MDEIRINNLEIFANHGVFPEENKLGQKFVVSCTLYLDTRKAGKGDRLEDSVHYGLIAQVIKKEMESHTFALIECVAEHLADIILDFDEKIREVEIEVKKPWAPVGLPLEDVSVTIRRKWHEVYVAFGSNMGERDRYIEQGIEALKKQKDCRILKVSMDTGMSNSFFTASITGVTRAISSSSEITVCPGRVDSPPISTMSAPSAIIASAWRRASSI